MIGAGRKDKLLEIQTLQETTTDEGETSVAPKVHATVYAAIEPLSSREAWFARQSQATTSHRITFWHVPGVTTKHRGLWNGRVFNFDSVMNPNEANREIVVEATEVI